MGLLYEHRFAVLIIRNFHTFGGYILVDQRRWPKYDVSQEPTCNGVNVESPKKSSIDNHSVPRTLMRSGSLGENSSSF